MNPLLPASLLLGCFALAGLGVAWMRSAPAGTAGLLTDEVPDEQDERPDPLARLRQRAAAAVTPQLLAMLSERRKVELAHRIDAAGRPDGLTVERYVEERAGQTLVLGLLGVVLLVAGANVGLLFPVFGWFGYDLKVRSAAERRQARIQRDLPDFLDVVSVTVRAGLGFRHALERVAQSLGGPLGDEVLTTLRQMSLGVDRRRAFEALRARNDSDGLDQFVSALLQAEELGTPLTDTMAGIADDLRDQFAQDAKERAGRTAPRINLVVILVILPGAALLLLAMVILGMDWGGGLL